MKRTIPLAVLLSTAALLAAARSWAQAAVEEPPVTAVAPPAAEAPLKGKPASKRRRLERANADARHCLDLPSNREIIKCAERYL
ncbi:MAG TPA: hypothetical protein VNM24_11545 [Burkholderiales bacterium]|jgi:hypothetical protein|nr:hypothetical protein [Burkholderiales bacterium]